MLSRNLSIELLRSAPKFTKRKECSSLCIFVLQKTSNKENYLIVVQGRQGNVPKIVLTCEIQLSFCFIKLFICFWRPRCRAVFYSLRRENCIRALINVYLSERTLHGPTASFLLLSNCKKIIDLSESTFFLYLQYLYRFTLYQVYEFSLMLKSMNVIFTYNVFPVSMLFFHHIY